MVRQGSSRGRGVFVFAWVLVLAGAAAAAPTEWKIADGGNGHYYEYVKVTRNWTDAKAAAEAMIFGGVPGHLVTISSAAENEFCRTLPGSETDLRAWIGLSDAASEGTFVWVTGEPLVYTNWNPGEPSNSGGIEHYVEMFKSGVWNDNRILDPVFPVAGYIVEWEVPHPPVFDEPTSPACGDSFDFVAGKELTFPVSASDVDAGATVTLAAVTLPAGATLDPELPRDGNPAATVFSWTPTADDVGAHTITFSATDETGRETVCTMTVTVTFDRDGDGLSDLWETEGYTYNGEFVNLPAMGADPDRPDIFVEIDYMTDTDHDHRPMDAAIATVITAFANRGIGLHVHVDESIAHEDVLGTGPTELSYDWSDFDAIKAAHFSEAKALAIHYCLFVHQLPMGDQTGTGLSRGNGASDFIVSLGATPTGVGTQAQQTGTFMHELGHNLGLRHGGGDNTLYKPNYLSVMNYLFQTTGLRRNGINGVFDYSWAALPTLDEKHLDERVGLDGPASVSDFGTRWYCGGQLRTTDAVNQPIDWDCDGNDDEADVAVDLNGDGFALSSFAGYDDWANLDYKGGTIGSGMPLPQPKVTEAETLDLTTNEIIEEAARPAPLEKVRGHVADKKLHLTWKPAPADAAGPLYRIYRSENGGPSVLIGTSSVSNFADADVEPGVAYTYVVVWVDPVGLESRPSAPVTLALRNRKK